jgi:DNA-binding NarL/FixJ family response regulator
MLDAAEEPAFARPWTSARISAPPPPASSVVRCAGWTSARSRSARAATCEHPLGLTRREREVLVLVFAGYTNAEIGAKLFISAKTIDHHVSAVLGKLGASTRQAPASQAARLGLASAAEI